MSIPSDLSTNEQWANDFVQQMRKAGGMYLSNALTGYFASKKIEIEEEMIPNLVDATIKAAFSNVTVKEYVDTYQKATEIVATCAETLGDGISYALAMQDVTVLAHTFVLIIVKMIGMQGVCSRLLAAVITRCVRCMLKQQNEKLRTEGPSEEAWEGVSQVLTAFWQMIAVARGVAVSPPKDMKGLAASVFDGLGSVSNKTRSLLLFFSNLCGVLAHLYEWFMDKVCGVSMLQRITYRDGGVMVKWTEEAITLTNPERENQVLNDCQWFARLVTADTVADYLAAEMNKAGCKDVPPLFSQYKKRLSILRQKGLNLGVATAYRPEPVCLWVSGTPGIGKTYMKDEVCIKLLQSVHVETTGNDIYPMNMAQKYWTGAENKHVIYYDDFATVEDSTILPESIGQFMQLVSDSRFAPPQAECEDKGKALRPLLVYVNANEENPSFNCLRNPHAFQRRRHICVEVRLTHEFCLRFGDKASLETKGAKAWLKNHMTEDNPTPHLLYIFKDPVSGKNLSDPLVYNVYMPRLVEMFQERYMESNTTYEKKMAAYRVLQDDLCDQPLQQILNIITSKASAEAGVSEACGVREYWKLTTQHMQDSGARASEWLKSFFMDKEAPQGPPQTEGEEMPSVVCSCHPLIALNIGEDENGEIVWIHHATKEGRPAHLEPCGEHCRMRLSWWRKRAEQRARSRGDVRMLQWLSKTWDRMDGVSTSTQTNITAPIMDHAADILTKHFEKYLTQREWPIKWKNVAIGLGMVTAIFSVLGGAYYFFFREVKSEEAPTLDVYADYNTIRRSEVISSGDIGTARGPAVGGIRPKVFASQSLETPDKNAVFRSEGPREILTLVDRNICYLVASGFDKATGREYNGLTMRCFGICGRWIIMLKHYIAKLNRTENLQVQFINSCGTKNQTINFRECNHKALLDSEIILVELPQKISAFKDIRKHMMTERSAKTLGSKGVLYEKALAVPGTVFEVQIKVAKELTYYDENVPFTIPTVFTYKWHDAGRCMTPLISKLGLGHAIIGFHICGGAGTGAAEPVIAETFSILGQQFDVELVNSDYIDINKTSRIVLEGDMQPEGIANSKYAVRPSEKTQIVPSAIHGYIPPVTTPAPLTPKDVDGEFSPLISGCNKHGMPPSGFDKDLLKRAQQHLRENYMNHCLPARPEVGVLSEQEAIVGIPALDGYQAMEMSTSEGFPFTGMRTIGESGKRRLFDIVENGVYREVRALDPALRRELDEKAALRDAGIIPFTVFTDCLKDARISVEKFKIPGKTRIFSISPTDFTIQFRQYFLDILASQKQNRLQLEHMVGMNVHSMEWTVLGRAVQSKGSKILCGDYSNFGPGLDSEVVRCVGEVWADWYEKHERDQEVDEKELLRRRQVRLIMFEELRHSVHLCKDIFYRVCCGSPSGAPCTVNINNDVNKMYIYMAWMECFKDNPLYNNMVSFNHHIALFVYGDDLILNVSDEVADKFNNEFLQNFFAKHNIRYTDDTKGDTIKKWGTFEEASFLKGKFTPHKERPFVYNYSLSKASIEDCANWIRNHPDPVAATHQAVCDSLMLAYGAGREYYDEHRRKLLAAWFDVTNEPLVLYTYDEMDAIRYGYEFDAENASLEDLLKQEREWRQKMFEARNQANNIMPLMTEAIQQNLGPVPRDGVLMQMRIMKKLQDAGVNCERGLAIMQDILDNHTE